MEDLSSLSVATEAVHIELGKNINLFTSQRIQVLLTALKKTQTNKRIHFVRSLPLFALDVCYSPFLKVKHLLSDVAVDK